MVNRARHCSSALRWCAGPGTPFLLYPVIALCERAQYRRFKRYPIISVVAQRAQDDVPAVKRRVDAVAEIRFVPSGHPVITRLLADQPWLPELAPLSRLGPSWGLVDLRQRFARGRQIFDLTRHTDREAVSFEG
jgi:hypothetical protein